ncbi:MAG: N-acetyltransferase family protein [Roseinatronobacter sp.]
MARDIRPIRPADRSDWAQLWQAYLAFYDTALPQDTFTATFNALMSDDPAAPHGFLALEDGQAVGLAHYLFHAHCWKPEGVCYLQDLYVDAAVRTHGLGRALIHAVYAAADARGVPSVYWTTQDFNAPARRLYDKVGQQTAFIKYVRSA